MHFTLCTLLVAGATLVTTGGTNATRFSALAGLDRTEGAFAAQQIASKRGRTSLRSKKAPSRQHTADKPKGYIDSLVEPGVKNLGYGQTDSQGFFDPFGVRDRFDLDLGTGRRR